MVENWGFVESVYIQILGYNAAAFWMTNTMPLKTIKLLSNQHYRALRTTVKDRHFKYRW